MHEYKFDPTKLKTYHALNFQEFYASNACVRIVDNTNLKYQDYANYIKAANGDICIVLSMLPQSPEILLSRNKHGLSLDSIKKMIAKYTPSSPAYYGLFPTKEYITSLCKVYNLDVTQRTPLHITVKFVGGDNKKNTPDRPELLGTKVLFSITGYSTSEAGHCLVTKSNELSGNHITLHTNEKFKPADVGKLITESNTSPINETFMIGLYLPMW
jgi:hypothetical protein